MVSLHKEPCLKSFLMVWVFDPSWSQSSQNGVRIVQLMFLYEARALASYRNIMSTIRTPLLAAFNLTRENRVFKPKTTFQVTRAGWARWRRPGRPVPQAPNSITRLQNRTRVCVKSQRLALGPEPNNQRRRRQDCPSSGLLLRNMKLPKTGYIVFLLFVT